jgi:S1/P1 Nuclease
MGRVRAFLALFIPSCVLAWGGDGHQIIALIAENRLTPAAQAAIHELLGDDLNISDAEICMWPDQIRRERRETAPWHYVYTPTSLARCRIASGHRTPPGMLHQQNFINAG